MRVILVSKRNERLLRAAVNSQYERTVEAAAAVPYFDERQEMIDEAEEYLTVIRRFWAKDPHANGGIVDANGFFDYREV